MPGQLRTLKNRIRSVENTKKITRAMEMVAAAKLRRFQDMMSKARPYTEGLENLVGRLRASRVSLRGAPIGATKQSDLKNQIASLPSGARNDGVLRHPFFEQRTEGDTVLVVFTSDTGLCGSYNQDLTRMALEFLRKKKGDSSQTGDRLEKSQNQPVPCLLVGVGKNGINLLKRLGYKFHKTFIDLRSSRIEEILAELKTDLKDLYLNQNVREIYVAHSHFISLSRFKPVTQKLLPLETSTVIASLPSGARNDGQEEYIFEPSPAFIFEKLIPEFFDAKTRMIFLESIVSEQIARMTAMHQATENAKEMIDSLVLERNKARQAAITKELIEVVSGSRALKIK